MNDNTWHYAVSDTEVLQPTQIEEMAVKTPENNWDLTLFTCTTTGQARYAPVSYTHLSPASSIKNRITSGRPIPAYVARSSSSILY